MAEEAKTGKVVTREEVFKHNTKEDCWIIINGKAYDVTKYLDEHPGGPEIIMDVASAGRDATEDFEDTGHSPEARNTLAKFFVGNVEGGHVASTASKSKDGPSLLVLLAVLAAMCAFAYAMYDSVNAEAAA